MGFSQNLSSDLVTDRVVCGKSLNIEFAYKETFNGGATVLTLAFYQIDGIIYLKLRMMGQNNKRDGKFPWIK